MLRLSLNLFPLRFRLFYIFIKTDQSLNAIITGLESQTLQNERLVTSDKLIELTAGLENKYCLTQANSEYVYLYVNVLSGEDTSEHVRVPLNISLVIDRRGSMSDENKLDFVKKACDLIINNKNHQLQAPINL